MERLLHAMGDVHPHELKGRLARELSKLTFERWHKLRPNRFPLNATGRTGKTIFCNSGFEAVEAALKTAQLRTGKRGVIAFEGAYHGLGYGTLNATHRKHFRGPFERQLGKFGIFVPFPRCSSCSCPGKPTAECGLLDDLERRMKKLFRQHEIGAVLVEPIQVRGGVNVPDVEFLNLLRYLCDRFGALLIVDEIYTGFGRTGEWFACESSAVVPDIICLGKALTGGFPLSACVGRADLMDAAWPVSTGEAIHTSTFLGHPVGCAMAVAQIEEIRRFKPRERSASLGRFLLDLLESEISNLKFQISFRGMGLLLGMELRRHDGAPATEETLGLIKSLLHAGFILLPEGEYSNVISFTPPLTISEAQLKSTVSALQEALSALK